MLACWQQIDGIDATDWKLQKLIAGVLAALVFLQAPANAQQSDDPRIDQAIARMTAAYGGDALKNLRTVSMKIDRRLAWTGQGQTADFVNFVSDRQHKVFDVQAQRGSVERWVNQNGSVFHNRFVVASDGAAVIDYFTMSKRPSEQGNYWRFYNGDYRSSDLLMAHMLATNPPAVKYERQETYRGIEFDVLGFEVLAETQRIEIFVSREDGLIHRAIMNRPIGPVNIIFSSHRKTEGIVQCR